MRIEGMDRFLNMLKRFETRTRALAVVEPALLAAAEVLRTKLATYPSQVHYPLVYASEKQRRYVMALTRKQGPYRRIVKPSSQRLKESWTTEKVGDGRFIVGTRSLYAPYVESAEKQQPMHKASGWPTEKDALESVRRSAVFERALEQAMKKALSGR